MLTENVLPRYKKELFEFYRSGRGLLSFSSNADQFRPVLQKTVSDLRKLLNIPDDYAVLFSGLPPLAQFAAVPLNICQPDDPVDYIVTGLSGDEAFKQASKFCKARVIWSGESGNYSAVPVLDELVQNPDAKYLHITSDEPSGAEFKNYPVPTNKDAILVADMSSNFCSKPIDVSRFGVIYADLYPNIGAPGTILIVRESLITPQPQPEARLFMDYTSQVDSPSLSLVIYTCGLVVEDLLEQGGLVEVEKKNLEKANIVYDAIDGSNGFYVCPVEKGARSVMNMRFRLAKCELETRFFEEAMLEEEVSLMRIPGVDGILVPICNAMPLASLHKLVAFMDNFKGKHV